MPKIPPRSLCRAAAFAAVVVGFVAAISAPASDAVILTDGFVLNGKVLKEGGAGYGFDIVEDGPKVTVFSMHTKKGGKVEKDVLRPDYVSYKREFPGTRGFRPPAMGELKGGDFNDNWRRTLEVKSADGNFTKIEQLVTYLDPNSCYVASTSHNMRVAYHTPEMDPKQVRQLLANHPDLKDKDPLKPDPTKRLAIAVFMKDAGWLKSAKEEIERAHKEIPGIWDKDALDREEKVKSEIEAAENRLVIDELEAAVGSGRYNAARSLLKVYAPKTSDPKDTTRLAVVKAQIETVLPKFDLTRKLMRDLLDRAMLGDSADAQGSLAGPAAVSTAPRKKPSEPLATLIAAGETVYEELHPDSVAKIEIFTTLAKQEDDNRKKGKPAVVKPDTLLAWAITGWLKGKSGAEENVDTAVKFWAARQMAAAYMADDVANNRRGLLNEYLKSPNALPADELAQVISVLPPTSPEDLTKPLGVKIAKADAGGVDGVWKRNTSGDGDDVRAGGVNYLLRLPPEYHHGRTYPVMIALTHPTIAPEKLVGSLAGEADKHGYIVVAPIWTGTFDNGYDFNGKQHRTATLVLRDLLRRFQVDADKVFLFGFGEGANFAFDLGLSHPDLFAGVVTFGPTSKWDIHMHTWRNAQKLPYFVVTGEYGGGSAQTIRKVYEKWMPRGFSALMTMYKGRGVEWYGSELPKIFDWMGRKSRVRGTASLRLNATAFEPWQICRESEDRFYWVGTTSLKPANTIERTAPGKALVPATIGADIRAGNLIDLQVFGIKNVVVWLERDMIDWTRPVKVQINGAAPHGYKASELKPDLPLMFEELYRTGDRKMLFLGKMTFDTPG